MKAPRQEDTALVMKALRHALIIFFVSVAIFTLGVLVGANFR